jgi:hypothetical protein
MDKALQVAPQLKLNLEPGMLDRYRNVREVVASGVYQRGLKRIAMDMDVAPGNLSCMLNDESQRKLGTDDLEHYIQATGDVEPIRYLITRYMGDEAAADAAKDARLEALMTEFVAIAGERCVTKKPVRR